MFASNAVEKCLTYGTLKEHQFLIDDILCSTGENEPLEVWYFSFRGSCRVMYYLEISKTCQGLIH